MVHSKLQTIRFAGTGWDNTGTHPGQIAIYLLKKIFHSILAVSKLPTAWQETNVVFIPKAGKAFSFPRHGRPPTPQQRILGT